MATDAPHSAFSPFVEESTPQAATGSPGKDGRLDLRFERADTGTSLVRDLATAPFHVAGTLDSDPVEDLATVIVQSPTGGIAQGDRRAISVDVGPDARATIGTASATKVYSMRRNYGRAELSLELEGGSHFEYLPEPLILHPDSRLYRSTDVDIEPTATAIIGDVIVPGRLARDEAHRFDRFVSEVEIRHGDGLLAADSLRLEPASMPLEGSDRSVVGTLFVVTGDGEPGALSDAIHEAVTAATPDGAVAGATVLPNGAGVLVRSTGSTTPDVRAALDAAWETARAELLDEPTPTRRR